MPPTMVVPAVVAEARISRGQRRLPLYTRRIRPSTIDAPRRIADHFRYLEYRVALMYP